MTIDAPSTLDFFAGGVPAGAIFQLTAKEIKKLLNAKPPEALGNTLEEMCFIGLVSYFEAFCRDCFASLLNICPQLLQRLKAKSYDVNIDSIAALEMQDNLPFQIGCLVAERFDFGSTKKINALYTALVGITPFSKDEEKVYGTVLSDRNLLVHHGGIFTHSYFHQRIGITIEKNRIFVDSLKIQADYVDARFTFLYGMAKKIVTACDKAMAAQIEAGDIVIESKATGALKMFSWWDEDDQKVGE